MLTIEGMLSMKAVLLGRAEQTTGNTDDTDNHGRLPDYLTTRPFDYCQILTTDTAASWRRMRMSLGARLAASRNISSARS